MTSSEISKTPEKGKDVENNQSNQDVPDGGWGWLVVLGVSISNMTTQALVSVFGFLFSARLAELNIATSGAAVILSVQSTVMNLSGLYTGALIRKFSYQKVAISGALLMMTGLMLTTLANSLTTYIVTYGIFTGLGLGFLYPSTFVAVNSYFSTKKGIAVGWSVTGTGIGQMLLPILVSHLLDEYGFRGTILILAALSGHSLVAALLYQPTSMHVKKAKKVKIVVDTPHDSTQKITEMNKTVADNASKGVRGLTIRRLSEPRNRSSASLHSIELEDEEEKTVPEKAGMEKKTNDWKIVRAMNKWAATNQGILIHTAIFRLTTYQGLEIRQAIEPKKYITSFFPNDMSGFLSNSIYSYFRGKEGSCASQKAVLCYLLRHPLGDFLTHPLIYAHHRAFLLLSSLSYFIFYPFFSTVVTKCEDAKQQEVPKPTIWRKLIDTLDYDLLRNGSFLIVIIGSGVIYTANTSFQMLYPLFLESLQYTRQEIASCMVALSVFDIVGRPILPYVVRFFKFRSKTIVFVSALISGILRSALVTQRKMVPILILSALCGLFRSAIITNMNMCVAEQSSRAKLPAALGLQMVFKGLASMSLGPLIGVIRDESHSFELCIHVLDVFFMGIPFAAYLIERLVTKKPS